MSDAPGITCEFHPDAVATAMCVDCEAPLCPACRRVGEGGLSRCVQCDNAPMADHADAYVDEAPTDEPVVQAPTPTASASAAPTPAVLAQRVEPLAWERPDVYTGFRAFWLTLLAMLRGPLQAVLRIPWEKQDLVTPLVLCVAAGVVGQSGQILAGLISGELSAELAPHLRAAGVPPTSAALLSTMTLPLVVTARLFVASGLTHLLLRMLGTCRRPFEATFRAYAYGGVPVVLGLVPVLGAPLGAALQLLIVLLSLRVAHRATPGQAFIAAAPLFIGLLFGAGL